MTAMRAPPIHSRPPPDAHATAPAPPSSRRARRRPYSFWQLLVQVHGSRVLHQRHDEELGGTRERRRWEEEGRKQCVGLTDATAFAGGWLALGSHGNGGVCVALSLVARAGA
ncbi:hypothetical protein ACQJBY_043006 [Aegilops geniculata]